MYKYTLSVLSIPPTSVNLAVGFIGSVTEFFFLSPAVLVESFLFADLLPCNKNRVHQFSLHPIVKTLLQYSS